MCVCVYVCMCVCVYVRMCVCVYPPQERKARINWKHLKIGHWCPISLLGAYISAGPYNYPRFMLHAWVCVCVTFVDTNLKFRMGVELYPCHPCVYVCMCACALHFVDTNLKFGYT